MKRAAYVTLFVVFAGGCGRTSPTAPSTLSMAPTAMVAEGMPTWTSLGIGTADLAVCLEGIQAPPCFSAVRPMRVDLAGVDAPGSPGDLNVTVTGNTVTLVWSAPTSGDAVVTYILEAGSTTGAANLANIVTNSTGTLFSASGIGAGTYFVRVRAQNAGGVSSASNEVVVVVGSIGCSSAPGAPVGLNGSLNSGTVTLSWTPPAGGCAPTSYILQAGSAPGLSNLANFNIGKAATSYVASGVPPGTYFLRVLAVNGVGTSGPSNETTVTSGSTCTPIAVSNPSFETPSPGGFPLTAGCQGVGCSYSQGPGQIPGWANSTFSGEFIPGVQVGNRFAFDRIPDGITVAYANTASISQTVAATVQVGAVYTLQVDLGWRKDYSVFTGLAALAINGRPIVATGTAPVQGNWSTFTSTYTGAAPDAGASIAIQLNSTGSFTQQADFDNVRLGFCRF